MTKIFLFAGEKSGDHHGAKLIHALKQLDPSLTFVGVGGPQMTRQGLHSLYPINEFTIIGFTDIPSAFPRIYHRFRKIKQWILTQNPPRVVLIDYPGFNLRLAKALKQGGYKGKIIQYISPSVWAWGKKRIAIMEENLDLLLTIYPFESELFSKTRLKTLYVGNPVKEEIIEHTYKESFSLDPNRPTISLFPGSRKKEILYNLPIQLKACRLLQKMNPAFQFAISVADDSLRSLIEKQSKDLIFIPSNKRYELMKQSHLTIAKAGTVTLELALHRCPTVVIYQLSFLNRFIIKYLLRVKCPFFCLPNIIANEMIFPELIRTPPTPETLAEEAFRLSLPGTYRDRCIKKCEALDALLSDNHASQKAAEAIYSQKPSKKL